MKNKKGFTLIELIVTMSIMAILAAVIVPTTIHFVNKADDEKKAAIMNDYMSRLIEVAQRQQATGKLDPDDPTCVDSLISMVHSANRDISGGYTVLGVGNDDNVIDYNTDDRVKNNPKYSPIKSGEGFTVCFFKKIEDERNQWYFRLKFYNNGKYSNISQEMWLRTE